MLDSNIKDSLAIFCNAPHTLLALPGGVSVSTEDALREREYYFFSPRLRPVRYL